MSYIQVEHDGYSVETSADDLASVQAALGMEIADPATDPKPGEGASEPETPVVDTKPDAEAETEKKDASPERNPDGTFKAKPKKGSLDRLIWEREDAERKAKAHEERAARLEAELAEARKPKPVEAPRPAQEPAPSAVSAPKFSFPTFEAWIAQAGNADRGYEEYVEERAYARVKHEQEREAADKAQRDQHESALRAAQAHKVREIAARQKYADYDARLQSAESAMREVGVGVPPVMGKAIVESDRSAEILYDLASHPEACIQLAREFADIPLTAASVVRRLLESRLAAASSGPATSTKPVTSAKPLIKPVSGSPVATEPADDYSDDEPVEKHIVRENARDRKAGRW